MVDNRQRVRLEEVDWLSTLPFLRLFRCFRIAVGPGKLLLALTMLIILCAGASIFDRMSGATVSGGEEIRWYAWSTPAGFAQWQKKRNERIKKSIYEMVEDLPGFDGDPLALTESGDRLSQATVAIEKHLADKPAERRKRLNRIRSFEPKPILDTAWRFKFSALKRMAKAGAKLYLGKTDIHTWPDYNPYSFVGAGRDLLAMGKWLFWRHRGTAVAWALFSLVVLALFGGAIARMTALQVTRDQRISPVAALRFSVKRWPWLFSVTLIPVVVVVLLALPLIVGGFVFFNVPGLDILGSLLYFVALGLGFLISMVMILHAASSPLFIPAIAVEGADGFDAVSRSFHYLLGRPWRYLFYSVVSAVYGMVTWVFFGFVVYLMVSMTRLFVSYGVVRDSDRSGMDRFEAMTPPVNFGQITFSSEGGSGAASGILSLWLWLILGLIVAYAITFYFSAVTTIYLLLRRNADGVDFDTVFVSAVTDPPKPSNSSESSPAAPAENAQPIAEQPSASSKLSDPSIPTMPGDTEQPSIDPAAPPNKSSTTEN